MVFIPLLRAVAIHSAAFFLYQSYGHIIRYHNR